MPGALRIDSLRLMARGRSAQVRVSRKILPGEMALVAPRGGASLKSTLLLGLGLFLTSVSLLGCRSISGPEKEIDGSRSFVRHCSRCHGADGAGVAKMQPIPDFRDPTWQRSRTDEQLRRVIQMGAPPRMPAYGRRFMEPTQASLVAAIRKLGAAKVMPSKPATASPAGSPKKAP